MHSTENRSTDLRLAWWREAKFGMFIHWGLYALPAGIWKGQCFSGIGEWIMFKARIPIHEYEALAQQFNPTAFDATAWVQLAHAAGMKYLILTAKHHDGFAMFASQASKFNIIDATPFKRDPVKELAAACHTRGIKFGVYYSQAQDWHAAGGAIWEGSHEAGPHWQQTRWDPRQEGDFDAYLKHKAEPQIRELLTQYGPISVLWFDTPLDVMTEARAARLARTVRELQSDTLISGRLGEHHQSDYESEGDNSIPKDRRAGDWETPATLNDTWGFKQNDTNWKSPATLIFNLVDIVSKGGNYLLNVGPDATGVIPQPSQDALREVGQWVQVNAESIYGSGPTAFGEEFGSYHPTEKDAHGQPKFNALRDWRCTTKPGKLYLHIFRWPGTTLALSGLPATVSRASLLGDPQQTALPIVPQGGTLTVQVPADPPHPIATVLRLELQSGDLRGC